MSTAKRGRRGRGNDPPEEISKEEYAVAKFLRFNVPTKTTTLRGMRVDYFVGSKAVDALVASKWGEKAKNDASRLFSSREDCVAYGQRLLKRNQLFHRARKIVQTKKSDKDEPEEETEDRVRRRKKEKETEETEEGGKKSKKKRKEEKKEEKREEESGGEEAGEGTPVVKEKKKKRIKLDWHEDQMFIDGNEAYVWIFDPIRPKTFVIGLLLVVGAIAVCLFPLWPEWMRIGAYYLSLAAAALLGVILALSVFRYVLYFFLWLATVGKVSFFLLPNLTEDVGFLESFSPLYELEVRWDDDDVDDGNREKKKKKRKKSKDSDAEGDSDAANSGADRRSDEGDENDKDENRDDEASPDDGGGVDDNEAVDDPAPPGSTGASASGSDGEFELIRHEDFNNGDK